MKLHRVLILLVWTLPMSVSLSDDKPVSPYPPSKVETVIDRLHGVEVADPYRWLEDADRHDVRDWVEKQNAYSASILNRLPGRDKIRAKLNELLDVGVIGTPVPVKGRYFYTKRDGKQNQAVLYVREGLKGMDRVLVDPNTLAADGTTTLDWWFPSEDGKLLAYGLSKDGSEQSTLYIRDVSTGKDLADVIERTRYVSVAWLPDNKGFFYTRYPAIGAVAKGDENYYRHVYFHALGTEPSRDPKVFGTGRPKEDMLEVAISPNGRWLGVTAQKGWSRSELYVMDLQNQQRGFVTLVENKDALFNLDLRNDGFYIHTNENAPRYRYFRVDPARPARSDWQELLSESDDVLDNVAVIGDTLVAKYMSRAASKVKLFTLDGKPIQELQLPTLGTVGNPGYDSGLGGEWDGAELFVRFQSFTVPPSVLRVDLKSRKSELWEKIPADVDPAAYVVRQVEYPSKDGTLITMFLTHKKGIEQDGKNPTLLYGYGGFNIPQLPTFNATRFAFLERGGVLAVTNLRGGGEYGEAWHKAGMLGNKQNVFDDFIGAAEHLIRLKITSPERLAIMGGSNGGLLTGAAMTQRPDLFRAVICSVPLLDMVRYHKFLIARLWIPEYGSADERDDFRWLFAYSPYHRVKDGVRYPATLLLAAESDSRVDALHARKMAARLQAATSSPQPILLRLETKAGHGVGKPRSKLLDETTDIWSFLFWQLGLEA